MPILTVSGSPLSKSRSARLLGHIAESLRDRGFEVDRLDVRDLPGQALLQLQAEQPDIRRALEQVASARAIVLATPIYKASFTGLLKAFLDLLPQDGLQGKTVLPIATGGTLAHFLALEYALKPVLAALDARHLLGSIFVLDSQIRFDESSRLSLDPAAGERIQEGLRRIAESLGARPGARKPQPSPAQDGGSVFQGRTADLVAEISRGEIGR